MIDFNIGDKVRLNKDARCITYGITFNKNDIGVVRYITPSNTLSLSNTVLIEFHKNILGCIEKDCLDLVVEEEKPKEKPEYTDLLKQDYFFETKQFSDPEVQKRMWELTTASKWNYPND